MLRQSQEKLVDVVCTGLIEELSHRPQNGRQWRTARCLKRAFHGNTAAVYVMCSAHLSLECIARATMNWILNESLVVVVFGYAAF